jgi:signal transduction histidine kinase
MEAMTAGAADYLAKSEISGPLLDRSIRYAIEQSRIVKNLRESESQVRLLSSQLLAAQETERRTLARDIHDGIGQTLAALIFGVEKAIGQCREKNPEAAEITLQNTVATIRIASQEIRRIQMNLRPSMLDDLGLLVTINWFCREFEKVYSAIRIEKQIKIEEDEIPNDLKIALYRIIQEAFNNMAKHGKGDHVVLSLEENHGRIALSIQDNGQGFDPEEVRKRYRRGMGLTSMKERAELSGGSFAIESSEGKGTIVRASWPLRGEG